MTDYRVERVPELPGGLPAIWEQDGRGGTMVYLRSDLPPDLTAHFLCMAAAGRLSA